MEEGGPIVQQDQPRSPQRFYKEVRTGETLTDGSRTPEFITSLSHSASFESNLGTTEKKNDRQEAAKNATAGHSCPDSTAGAGGQEHSIAEGSASSSSMKLSPDGGASEGIGHHDSALLGSLTRLRCPVVRECTAEVDLRWPYQLVSLRKHNLLL